MDELENMKLIKTEFESCPHRGNLEISTYEDEHGNETTHTVNQDGEEWID